MSATVLIVGNTGAEALESSYDRAFSHLGWAVRRWNPLIALHKVARFSRFGQLFSTFVQVEPWLRKANLELLNLADELQPQLILVIGTGGVRPGTLAQIRVRIPRCRFYCIFPDSPHFLDSDRIHALPFFDRVTTSSPAWVSSFANLGARRVFYLPFAADTFFHAPVTDTGSIARHDLAFIGTWRRERELLLEQLGDFDLSIWGSSYWKRRTQPGSPLKQRWAGRPVQGKEFAQVCSASKILLNLMDAPTYPGPNMRTFEQAACGAFSLSTRSPAVLELFQEGQTIECFASVEEARSKIRYYLEHEDARQRIAEASYQYVVHSGHTYLDRANQLIRWLNEDSASD